MVCKCHRSGILKCHVTACAGWAGLGVIKPREAAAGTSGDARVGCGHASPGWLAVQGRGGQGLRWPGDANGCKRPSFRASSVSRGQPDPAAPILVNRIPLPDRWDRCPPPPKPTTWLFLQPLVPYFCINRTNSLSFNQTSVYGVPAIWGLCLVIVT